MRVFGVYREKKKKKKQEISANHEMSRLDCYHICTKRTKDKE